VISVSYGQIEGALPRFYQERQCREWMKLALQGVSVIFASGDSGVANRYNSGYNNSCLNSEYGYVDTDGTRFSPSFPANCPYVSFLEVSMLDEIDQLTWIRSPLSAPRHCSTHPYTAANKRSPSPEAVYRIIRVEASQASSPAPHGNLKLLQIISTNTRLSTGSRFSTLPVVRFPTLQHWA
jgi:hypothetical protein